MAIDQHLENCTQKKIGIEMQQINTKEEIPRQQNPQKQNKNEHTFIHIIHTQNTKQTKNTLKLTD